MILCRILLMVSSLCRKIRVDVMLRLILGSCGVLIAVRIYCLLRSLIRSLVLRVRSLRVRCLIRTRSCGRMVRSSLVLNICRRVIRNRRASCLRSRSIILVGPSLLMLLICRVRRCPLLLRLIRRVSTLILPTSIVLSRTVSITDTPYVRPR